MIDFRTIGTLTVKPPIEELKDWISSCYGLKDFKGCWTSLLYITVYICYILIFVHVEFYLVFRLQIQICGQFKTVILCITSITIPKSSSYVEKKIQSTAKLYAYGRGKIYFVFFIFSTVFKTSKPVMYCTWPKRFFWPQKTQKQLCFRVVMLLLKCDSRISRCIWKKLTLHYETVFYFRLVSCTMWSSVVSTVSRFRI